MLLSFLSAYTQPGPGDVFKEYTYYETPWSPGPVYRSHFAELDPGTQRQFSKTSGMYNRPRMVVKELDVDLDQAVKAEVSVEYWGGHIGTSEQKFRINGNEWIPVPQPRNTPGKPQCYYRTILGNESVEVPLQNLKDGRNEFQFTCGSQICYSFDWGFYWIYAFTLRVYYQKSRQHAEGRIVQPVANSSLPDTVSLVFRANNADPKIASVDYIGRYEDFDWEGNGVYRQWHYQTQHGYLKQHIGTSRRSPFSVEWYDRWLPDQEEPVSIMAKVTDENGMCYMTPAVTGLTFTRSNGTVRMYKPHDVPEKFGVRVGNTASCKIEVGDPLENARSACLIVSSWSGKNDDGSVHEIRLNGKRISDNFGRFHDYSFDRLHVPLEYIKPGVNEVSVYSEFHGHALEINWPGPVLFIEFE
jgi:hypothetical protein